jgi:hypothetical protein
MIEAVAVWLWFDLAQASLAAAAGEPWVTLIFFVSAIIIVVQRWSRRQLARKLLEAEGETEVLRQLLPISLAVRDQVNTPLQTLELGVALLKMRHPGEQRTLDRMGHSLQKLIGISRSFDWWAETAQGITSMRAVRKAGEQLDKIKSAGV